jgi:hypothetical protein
MCGKRGTEAHAQKIPARGGTGGKVLRVLTVPTSRQSQDYLAHRPTKFGSKVNTVRRFLCDRRRRFIVADLRQPSSEAFDGFS